MIKKVALMVAHLCTQTSMPLAMAILKQAYCVHWGSRVCRLDNGP